ncbi:uncharacterized protein LOC135214310 [Macrobrachium nipponense]|uniref:uncharacterized protein LOC135214310 n=1 Tax=Macrobrachium nipponense TaxID=159736 RepID=UPI0030C7D31B
MSSHFQASCLVLGIFLLLTTCSSRDLNPLELGLFKAMVDKCLGDKTYFIAGFCQDVFQRADELGLLSEGKVTSESPLPVHTEGETNATGEPSPSNHAKMYDMSKRNTSEVRRDRKHVRTDVGVADTSHFDGRTHQGQLTGHQVNTENDPEVKKVTESSHNDRRFRKETMPVKFARSNQGKRSIKQLTEDAMSHVESVDSREFNEAHLQLAYDFVELLRVALQRESENEFSRAKENIGYALSATFDIESPDVVQQETEGLITFMVKLLEEDSDGDDEKAATDVAEHLKRRMSDISQCSSKGVDASLIDITTTTPMSPHDNYEETLAVEEADIPPTETSAEGKDSTGHWEKNQMERKDRRPRRDIERWIPKSRYDVDDSRLSGERYKATYLSSEAAEKAVGNEDQEIEECFARYIVAEELFKSENLNE